MSPDERLIAAAIIMRDAIEEIDAEQHATERAA